MDYNFYFDEAFHDRKITLCSNGKANTMQNAALDSYVGVFWGCNQKEIHTNIALINTFEEKEKKLFSLTNEQELKSSIIPISQYKFGVHSMNKNAKLFTSDLFELIDHINPIIQINAISKFELLWRNVFSNVVFPPNVIPNSFFYSLTKLTIEYKPRKLIEAIFNEESTTKTIIDILRSTLSEIIRKSKGVVRKEREIEAFKQTIYIIDNYVDFLHLQEKYLFPYSPNFDGLINLLTELRINPRKCKLTIDREDKTFSAASKMPFGHVKQADSINSLPLHLSDLIGGFIGRMMYCLSNDPSTIEAEYLDDGLNDVDFDRKRLLSPQWFNLSEQDYQIYLLIYKSLILEHQHYWTTMTLSYCDQIVRLYSFLRYIASYKLFADFQKITIDMHSEYFNSACCRELEEHYNQCWN